MAVLEIPNNPTWRDLIAVKLANRSRTRRDAVATNARTWVQELVKLLMHVGGFACLTIAGFSFSFRAGMIVAGVSCFVFSWLTQSNTSMTETTTATPIDPILRRR
jgi:hypothetical protein